MNYLSAYIFKGAVFYHQNRASILGVHTGYGIFHRKCIVRFFQLTIQIFLIQPISIFGNMKKFKVDCAEDLLPCNGITCSWDCNIEGSVGSEQKVCKSTCEDDERIYTARCSCVEMFGPIQIAAPCKWKHWKAPVCEIPTTTTTSTTKTTATTSTTTTTTTEEETEAPKRWVKPQPKKSEKSTGKVQFFR